MSVDYSLIAAHAKLEDLLAGQNRIINLLIEIAGKQSTMRAELIAQDDELEALTNEVRELLNQAAGFVTNTELSAAVKLLRCR